MTVEELAVWSTQERVTPRADQSTTVFGPSEAASWTRYSGPPSPASLMVMVSAPAGDETLQGPLSDPAWAGGMRRQRNVRRDMK